jgi:hypothetical protein
MWPTPRYCFGGWGWGGTPLPSSEAQAQHALRVATAPSGAHCQGSARCHGPSPATPSHTCSLPPEGVAPCMPVVGLAPVEVVPHLTAVSQVERTQDGAHESWAPRARHWRAGVTGTRPQMQACRLDRRRGVGQYQGQGWCEGLVMTRFCRTSARVQAGKQASSSRRAAAIAGRMAASAVRRRRMRMPTPT